jgi:hypothetical protein
VEEEVMFIILFILMVKALLWILVEIVPVGVAIGETMDVQLKRQVLTFKGVLL